MPASSIWTRTDNTGRAVMQIPALTQVSPGARNVVDEHATDEGKALLDKLQTMTTAEAVWQFRNVDLAAGAAVVAGGGDLDDAQAAKFSFDAVASAVAQSLTKW
jgi:hypothetical protein